jgi:hypothetical protein
MDFKFEDNLYIRFTQKVINSESEDDDYYFCTPPIFLATTGATS